MNTTPSLYPFDPRSAPSAWTLHAFGIETLPVFEPARVGNHRHAPTTCSLLYRFFDDDRLPLYIGVTTNPRRRWQSHKHTQWWYQARFVSLEPVPPLERLERERIAIKAEKPRFNVLRPGEATRTRVRLDLGAALIVDHLRERMSTDNFTALIAAFHALPSTGETTS